MILTLLDFQILVTKFSPPATIVSLAIFFLLKAGKGILKWKGECNINISMPSTGRTSNWKHKLICQFSTFCKFYNWIRDSMCLGAGAELPDLCISGIKQHWGTVSNTGFSRWSSRKILSLRGISLESINQESTGIMRKPPRLPSSHLFFIFMWFGAAPTYVFSVHVYV